MSSNNTGKAKGGTKHYDSYPEGEIPVFLSYGFRPFFILLPIYIVVSIILWALF